MGFAICWIICAYIAAHAAGRSEKCRESGYCM